ncbi:hypothetical protein ACWYXK_03805 [Janthinobacterium lividum]|uniref:Uncharacterized protein n=1 Tax=Janthinobacterium lividum TaxID=29581 RepID=A0ABU0XUP7_9BURK|nr:MULTISPECIES: hypothetical protein [Janthinobacterium]MBR7632688.1 hypothetical protein [Janthinobacterium lividum]MDO8034759.1 hypothetical protein [Janthinobacterium sp. SUN128]MDQ4625946.1 hypothetical protein [Janthinobacterium lividum]MDQ4675087.1 hypothetical protein [Janthinobacterium lividum]PHV24117.1 hypothetical protein CSQ92_14685 [Janthinobacterium sp. BJB446]
MIAFQGVWFDGYSVLRGAASSGGGGDMQNYPPLSRASIVQIEGAFAACSAERLALALVLWNPGNM